MGLDTTDDAAVMQVPEHQVMVQTVDYFPGILDDSYLLGKITANHCLNDLFAMGATPQSALAIVTLPEENLTQQQELLYQLLLGTIEVLNTASAVLVGGHTTEGKELAFGLTCNGLAFPNELLQKTGLKPGNILILTKPLGTGTLFAADTALQAKRKMD
jgi:selenide,water dikinase